MSLDAYHQFLARKRIIDPMTGLLDVGELPSFMKPHQRDITAWALRRGRAAIFAGTGLGKTLMELVWGHRVAQHTGKPVLAFAPLAVSAQHIREGEKFGISAFLAKIQDDVRNGLFVTNYQKIEHFDLSKFGGVVLDESSILKSTDGHYRTRLIEECNAISFRLAATATPAPNDFMELGNHAEFLGVMSYTDMLATFFVHDGGDTQKWRLKGHAENEFWKWMASWAVMIRKPSDLGYDNTGYDLPPLEQIQHTAGVAYEPSMETGLLFPMQATSLSERIGARRASVEDRVKLAVMIVNGSRRDKLATCGSQNTPPVVNNEPNKTLNIAPSETPKGIGEMQKNVSNITENGTIKTENTSENIGDQQPMLGTNGDASATRKIKNTGKKRSSQQENETKKSVETPDSGLNSELDQQNTMNCSGSSTVSALSADAERLSLGSTLITATKRAELEEFYAPHAIQDSVNSGIIRTGLSEPSNIYASQGDDLWIIWCGLNTEQDALEKAFAGRCISVRGSNSDDENERRILAWLRGEKPIIISKPSMLGFGLNFQHCNKMIFVGLNDSFEQVYQAIRRCWRFGQTKPVTVHFIAAETEGAVVANLRRKELDAERMAAAMVAHMADLSAASVRGMVRDRPDYDPQKPMQIPSWIGEAA